MTLSAIPIFVAPGLVNAILPGSTPTGAATLTVAYGGQTSNIASFQVVASSFGIFTVNSNGAGAGIISRTSYQLYPVNAPANPNDVAVIWGTGIGASPGDDGSAPPQQIDMPNLPVSVYVGTQAASVIYRGRAAFTGEDQINFVVPAGVTGCYVPVAVQIGDIVSNFVTMPIAPAGQSCPDPTPPVPSLGSSSYVPDKTLTGDIELWRTTQIGATTSTTDSGDAFFGDPQVLSFPYAPPIFGNPYSLPAGTCIGGVTFPPVIDVLVGELPAGTLTITGPNGSQQLTAPPNFSGMYSAQLGGGSGSNAPPLYLDAGAYSVSGPGGTVVPPVAGSEVVGPFSQTFTIPQPFTWTNQDSISTVDRSAGLDVTWAGGDPNGTVQITGDVVFICNANISDHHFTIPAFVLLGYPVSFSPAGSSA